MVFFFTSRCGHELYMGRDKVENEVLIAYGWDTDVWLHVDDLSSAHVYLRQNPGQTLDDISPELLLDMCTLVKANSIAGCKKSEVAVVYTRWKNLKKTKDMVDGAVGFHRPNNVRRINHIEKNNSIVNILNKTKREESSSDWWERKEEHEREMLKVVKAQRVEDQKVKKSKEEEKARLKEELSYDRVLSGGVTNKDVKATADSTAAEDFEDDFM